MKSDPNRSVDRRGRSRGPHAGLAWGEAYQRYSPHRNRISAITRTFGSNGPILFQSEESFSAMPTAVPTKEGGGARAVPERLILNICSYAFNRGTEDEQNTCSNKQRSE